MTKSKAKAFRTQAELAKHLGVTPKTVASWKATFSDWPEKTEAGNFDLKAVDRFLRRHKLGPHNPARNGEGGTRGQLTEARTTLLHRRITREEITLEREAIELAKQRDEILLMSDVVAFHKEIAQTLVTLLTDSGESLDQDLPAVITAEAWPEIRARLIARHEARMRDILSIVERLCLVAGEAEESTPTKNGRS